MGKPVIVIADRDEKYIAPLELKFVGELYRDADIEIISGIEYFKEYFSVHRKLSLLVTDETFYDESLGRHDIERIFVLSEDPVRPGDPEGQSDDSPYERIFKYSSIAEIFNGVMGDISDDLSRGHSSSRETQIVLFYSADGGAGKTTVAIGTAACLSANHKKVIYIDAEYIHTFHRYLTDKSFASNNVYSALQPGDQKIFDNIRHYIRNERFDYIPPFCASISSLNIGFGVYKALAEAIRATGIYDYIVIDVDSSLDADKTELFDLADRVVILLSQDYYSVFKTDVLMNSINVADKDKNLFVCNKFRSEGENAILSEGASKRFVVSEYIEYVDDIDSITVAGLSNIKSFQKLAFLLL
jgi:cellulose biosynthesis protein BcsQ